MKALLLATERWFGVGAAVCLVSFSFCLGLLAQPYAIDWYTIDGGGGTSTGGVYAVSGTLGQPDAGPNLANGQYDVAGGFWGLIAVQTLGAPLLIIEPAGPEQATISWNPDDPWLLQEATSLVLSNWVDSASGPTNPVAVSATGPRTFYRLRRP